jgi:hypothetical protein
LADFDFSIDVDGSCEAHCYMQSDVCEKRISANDIWMRLMYSFSQEEEEEEEEADPVMMHTNAYLFLVKVLHEVAHMLTPMFLERCSSLHQTANHEDTSDGCRPSPKRRVKWMKRRR